MSNFRTGDKVIIVNNHRYNIVDLIDGKEAVIVGFDKQWNAPYIQFTPAIIDEKIYKAPWSGNIGTTIGQCSDEIEKELIVSGLIPSSLASNVRDIYEVRFLQIAADLLKPSNKLIPKGISVEAVTCICESISLLYGCTCGAFRRMKK